MVIGGERAFMAFFLQPIEMFISFREKLYIFEVSQALMWLNLNCKNNTHFPTSPQEFTHAGNCDKYSSNCGRRTHGWSLQKR